MTLPTRCPVMLIRRSGRAHWTSSVIPAHYPKCWKASRVSPTKPTLLSPSKRISRGARPCAPTITEGNIQEDLVQNIPKSGFVIEKGRYFMDTQQHRRDASIFLGPAVFLLFLLMVYPSLETLRLSFFDRQGQNFI